MGTTSRRAFLGWTAAGIGGLMAGGVATTASAAVTGIDNRLATGTGWRDFLGTLDLTWQSIPTGFYQGPFLGNGGLGAVVYQRGGTKLAFTLGDSRVRDHQPGGDPLWGSARLPIGYFTLSTTGTITSVDLRLSLHNAELSGFVHTTSGSVSVRAFVSATTDLLVVSTVVAAGTETVTWTFTPLEAVSPRKQFFAPPAGLLTNPAAVVGPGVCTQDLACGGRTETRWIQRTEADGVTRTLLVTVAHSATDHTASTTAASTMSSAAALTVAQLAAPHRAWWNAFYAKSFVSVPDTKLQSFYWIQLYKMASATRADRPVLGTLGPWVEPTPWPGTWWNLNVQLEYWLINATGHTELDSLRTALENGLAGLQASTPAAYRADSLVIGRATQDDLRSPVVGTPGATSPNPEVGNLTWTLHNAWLAYRHTMDDDYLRDTVFPLLRKAINYYLHFLTKDANGVYHLPLTYSPEYATTSDCNYDLALIYWGCRTLLSSATRLGISDPLAATWQDVLANLTPPPQDATQGLWIGKDKQLTSSHRHYSHLLWFYPLYNYDVTDPVKRDLLVKSVAHWQSLTGSLQGYSFTGSGSMYAVLGDGTKALAQLNQLITGYVKQNTMYAESGPVIETPLSAAQTMHDMLMQSWGGTIRVFPAVPSAWANAAFHDLRAEGAFLVSARKRAGVTEFVRVKSLAGEPLRVLANGLTSGVSVQPVGSTPAPVWSQNAQGVITITLAAGGEVVITKAGTSPSLVIDPVVTTTKASWGLPPTTGGTPVPLTFTNDGISWQSSTTDGNLDGVGHTYPAEEMPTPGVFVSGGVTWQFPSYAAGQKNNATGTGQTITVPVGRYTELHLLASGNGGNVSGAVTLTYADGSTTTATLNVTDWGRVPAFGEQVAVFTTHRHSPTGDHSLKVRIFHQKLTVANASDLRSITLPVASRLHVFAVTVR